MQDIRARLAQLEGTQRAAGGAQASVSAQLNAQSASVNSALNSLEQRLNARIEDMGKQVNRALREQERQVNAALGKRGGAREGSRVAPPPAAPAAGGGTAPAPADMPRTGSEYTVRTGDTLTKIARRNNSRVEWIKAANPGIHVRTLQPGKKIFVPQKQPAAAAVPEPSAPAPAPVVDAER